MDHCVWPLFFNSKRSVQFFCNQLGHILIVSFPFRFYPIFHCTFKYSKHNFKNMSNNSISEVFEGLFLHVTVLLGFVMIPFFFQLHNLVSEDFLKVHPIVTTSQETITWTSINKFP
jgi:hypothetical protein